MPRLPRNLDPALHPFAKAREYTRALNATKLERMFAQPFIAQLGKGHVDGVYCLAKDPKKLSTIASGSADGIVKMWDLASRTEDFSVHAHENQVNGLCYTTEGRLLSCSADKTVKLWEATTKTVLPPIQADPDFTACSNIPWFPRLQLNRPSPNRRHIRNVLLHNRNLGRSPHPTNCNPLLGPRYHQHRPLQSHGNLHHRLSWHGPHPHPLRSPHDFPTLQTCYNTPRQRHCLEPYGGI